MTPPKTIGILGGMGPYATISFYQKILDLSGATKDWEHCRTVIDVNTHIPSRSRHYLYHEASPVPAMIQSCKCLENYPVDFIVIPCNSASHYIHEIQSSIETPIINIMEITVQKLLQHYPLAKNISVLGGAITYYAKTYKPYLENNGFNYLHHSEPLQRKAEEIIEKIKLNTLTSKIELDLNLLLSQLHKEQRFDVLIFGCTEFGCLHNIDSDISIIDSSLALAQYAINYANGYI
ncbi:aspartate/glutamate racemase family protein [Methylomonas sp. LL1]|uniref:aspartate/glutamate racemase family protein n=1 Tax=Methylomonas sp. LL1 TaxID=2785785 RepID=UPI0018C3A1F4|nr:amino acid racemase [Methylomonas sp. LL1]QPK63429.1 aspartate/glutamate racemase family protein [Methylomonas sp. LL1]